MRARVASCVFIACVGCVPAVDVDDDNDNDDGCVHDVDCGSDAVCALAVCGVDDGCDGCGYVARCVDVDVPADVDAANEGEGEPLPRCTIAIDDSVVDGTVVLEDRATVAVLAQKTAITGDLVIVVPPDTDLRALSSLTAIGGSLVVDAAVDLTPLAGLACVGVDVDLHTFTAANFPQLTTVPGSVHIIEPDVAIADLSFLAALTATGEDLHVESSHLSSLAGLAALTSIGGYLTFDDVDGVVDDARRYGLPALRGVGVVDVRKNGPRHLDLGGVVRVGDVLIEDSPVVDVDLAGALVVGRLSVHGTTALASLHLPSAQEIELVDVVDNAALVALTLPARAALGVSARVRQNPALTTLDLGTGGPSVVDVADNAALATCAAERAAIAAGSVNDGAVVGVDDNAGPSCRCE